MAISIRQDGRRLYLVGDTYPVKDQIRSAGGKWDLEHKAWYVGVQRRDVAERIITQCAGGGAAATTTTQSQAPPGLDAVVACRATYHGHTYYAAGRIERGRTHWDDQVRAVESRDGSRVLLYFRDGSRSFWAATADVTFAHMYGAGRGSTIRRVREAAERMAQMSPEERDEAREDAAARAVGEQCPCSGGACRCGSDAPCCMCD